MSSRPVMLFIVWFTGICLPGPNGMAQDFTKTNEFTKSLSIYDKDGKPFVDDNTDVDGSAYFKDAWNPGYVWLSDGKVYSIPKLKFNLLNQKIHYLGPGNTQMVASGEIKQIRLTDSVGNNAIYLFSSGYPAIDNQNEKSLYLELSKGKLSLLKSIKKTIVQRKNEISGETRKEFVTYEDYYLFNGKTIQRLKKDKAFIDTQLEDKQQAVADFMSKNKLHYKSVDDIKKIIDYYNTLP